MYHPLVSLAIKNALSQNWKEAIRINQELIEANSEDIDALNRLAYAFLKSGNIPSSKTTYKKVLKIDKYNPIALKNLRWISNLNKGDIHQDPSISPTPTIFLEEPGKTRIITLVHPAPIRILCNITTAQRVYLIAKRHSVEIRDGKDVYIGALPDDLSHRLVRFISSGNVYDAYIKNVAKNTVTIFVRELKRGKKFALIPSFSVYNTISSHNLRRSNQEPTSEKDKEGESVDGSN